MINRPTTSTLPEAARDGTIDLLRALLVLYVVGYLHLGGYIGNGETHVHWSTVAVTNVVLGSFTFLSGYVLGVWKGGVSAPELGRFYWRRLLRIYPLYLVALAGFVLLWLVDLNTALKAAAAVSMFWPQPPMTLWFITMIIVCYLLAPLMVAPSPRQGIVWAIALWLLMLLFNFGVHEIDPRMLTQFPAFAAGVASRRLGWRAAAGRRMGWLAPVFALTLAAAVATLPRPLVGAIVAIPSVIVGPLLLMAAADRWCPSWGHRREIVFLSHASLAMYLFHRIVYELLKRAWWPDSSPAQWAELLLLGLPLVIMSSAVIQRAYDWLLAAIPALGAAPPRSPAPGSSSR